MKDKSFMERIKVLFSQFRREDFLDKHWIFKLLHIWCTLFPEVIERNKKYMAKRNLERGDNYGKRWI